MKKTISILLSGICLMLFASSCGKQATTQGQVLLDQNDVVITYNSMGESLFGPEISFTVENNTDQNITVQSRDEKVNGKVIAPILSQNVSPGETATAKMTYVDTQLEEKKAMPIKKMEFSFHIYVSDTSIIVLDSETVTLIF